MPTAQQKQRKTATEKTAAADAVYYTSNPVRRILYQKQQNSRNPVYYTNGGRIAEKRYNIPNQQKNTNPYNIPKSATAEKIGILYRKAEQQKQNKILLKKVLTKCGNGGIILADNKNGESQGGKIICITQKKLSM